MNTCLTFTLRHQSRPLHLCYDNDPAAEAALREFARNIDASADGQIVVVVSESAEGAKAQVGFLKRDFRSIEVDSLPDDDSEDAHEPPEDDETKGSPHNAAGSGRALQAAVKIVRSAGRKEK